MTSELKITDYLSRYFGCMRQQINGCGILSSVNGLEIGKMGKNVSRFDNTYLIRLWPFTPNGLDLL